MKIGIISDTHNNIKLTEKALSIFKENNVDIVVHAGDITSRRMLSLFKDIKSKFVLGNGDIDVEELNAESEKLGFGSIEKECLLEIDGKSVLIFHGDNVRMFRDAVASGNFDYIIKGHTHFYENYTSNKTRIINPGALYGSDEYSIAILDTLIDRVEMHRVQDE